MFLRHYGMQSRLLGFGWCLIDEIEVRWGFCSGMRSRIWRTTLQLSARNQLLTGAIPSDLPV